MALGRGRRDPLQGGGFRLDAGRGAAATGVGRPPAAGRATRAARCATSSGCCSRAPRGLPVRAGRERAAIGLYESVGMRHVLDYRSVLF